MTAALTALVAVLAGVALGLWWRTGALRRRAASLEEETARLRHAAAEARRTGDDFLDLVSHELRSPLTTILGYQELLADGTYGEIDDARLEPVQRIGRSARHLLRLMDGMLDLTEHRVTPTPKRVAVDPAPLLARAGATLRSEADGRGTDLSVDLSPAPATLHTDPVRLERLLHLAFTSAARHPAEKGLTVTARAEDGLRIDVRGTALPADDGQGAGAEPAADAIARIGLRLAIVRRLARMLGGNVELARDPDDGTTTLRLRLPDQP